VEALREKNLPLLHLKLWQINFFLLLQIEIPSFLLLVLTNNWANQNLSSRKKEKKCLRCYSTKT